jgi:hypothetical protein
LPGSAVAITFMALIANTSKRILQGICNGEGLAMGVAKDKASET